MNLMAKIIDCRVEMSQNVNTCPVDRQVFRLILVRDGCEGIVYRRIPVAHREMHVDDVLVPDNTFCEVCGRADHEDRLLLCDGCNLGFVECLLCLHLISLTVGRLHFMPG